MKISRTHLSKAQIAMMTAHMAINAEKLSGMSPTQVAQLINKTVDGITTCTAHHVKAYAPHAGVILRHPATTQPKKDEQTDLVKHRLKEQDEWLHSIEKRLASICPQVGELTAWRREKEPMFVAVFECAQKNSSELDAWTKALDQYSVKICLLENAFWTLEHKIKELEKLTDSLLDALTKKQEQPNGLETN